MHTNPHQLLHPSKDGPRHGPKNRAPPTPGAKLLHVIAVMELRYPSMGADMRTPPDSSDGGP